MKTDRKKCVLLVDVVNIFMRGYSANPAISSQGENIGGIITFLSVIKHVITRVYPVDEICCVWDGVGGSVRRRSIFKEYKNGSRPKRNKKRFYEHGQQSNSAYQQLALINILQCLPVRQFSVANCEADDVINYLCEKYISEGFNVIILSTDKDYFQLVDNNVVIYNSAKYKFYKMKEILEEYGIHPYNWALARSIIGDPSDNINGIYGISFKTCNKLFPMLRDATPHTLSELYLYVEQKSVENPKNKMLIKIKEQWDIIERNFNLIRLSVDFLTLDQVKEVDCSIINELSFDRSNFIDRMIFYGVDKINLNAYLDVISYLNFTQ